MAEDYIKRATTFLKEAELAFQDEDFATSVRRSQECVELSLKAVLRLFAIEYPREHDVSPALALIENKETPTWFKELIPSFIEISKELGKKRGPAIYGYESELKPASEIFGRGDAEKAINSAKLVYSNCKKVIREFFS